MSDDENAMKRALYMEALYLLNNEDQKWGSNLNTYRRWDPEWRAYWIKHMEKQARDGAPMAVKLIAKVAELRITA